MTGTHIGWARVVREADALSLSKLLIGSLAFVLWHGSPLFAIGAAFAAPLLFAILVHIGRELHFALTGRVRGVPPPRLGQPSWERRHNERLLTERPASAFVAGRH